MKNKQILKKIGVVYLTTALLTNQGVTAFASSANLDKTFPITYNPGHGGNDPGFNGWVMSERDVCIDIAKGFNYILDTFSIENATANDNGNNINKRNAFAEKMKSFNIEIHNNASDNTSAYGFEIFVENKLNTSLISPLEYMCASVSKKLDTKNRGVKTDKESGRGKLGSTYIAENSIGIIIEVGFLSNPKEAAKFDTEEKRFLIGALLASEFLASFDIISNEDGDAELRKLATKYNFIKEEPKLLQIKEVKAKQADKAKDNSIDEIIENIKNQNESKEKNNTEESINYSRSIDLSILKSANKLNELYSDTTKDDSDSTDEISSITIENDRSAGNNIIENSTDKNIIDTNNEVDISSKLDSSTISNNLETDITGTGNIGTSTEISNSINDIAGNESEMPTNSDKDINDKDDTHDIPISHIIETAKNLNDFVSESSNTSSDNAAILETESENTSQQNNKEENPILQNSNNDLTDDDSESTASSHKDNKTLVKEIVKSIREKSVKKQNSDSLAPTSNNSQSSKENSDEDDVNDEE